MPKRRTSKPQRQNDGDGGNGGDDDGDDDDDDDDDDSQRDNFRISRVGPPAKITPSSKFK
ncbi:hypothetical protein V1477_005801 [Vespula maculifrons]|uniref:Uncharacterized protein n=1 Tax=Vespula maculifrons TaxID=7453 RepID=A0ABD2CL97_VESMC